MPILGIKLKWNRKMLLKDYIKTQLQKGKCSFSLIAAMQAMATPRKAVLSSIAHLLKAGNIISPAKGFYLIVPPEYQILKCLPAEYFISYLMEYWGLEYYAALLTAARYHGATHQSTQVFQVMIPPHKPEIVCGKVKVKFYTNKHLQDTPTQKITTSKSILTISTPEGTAMDLMRYIKQAGGLSHIATVLSELQEVIDPEKLFLLAEHQSDLAWKQRLGYLLELLDATKLVEALKMHLTRHKKIDYIPLMPGITKLHNVSKNKVWKILENTNIEGDI
jgi:predicted transcriptional regulator of viral defense system